VIIDSIKKSLSHNTVRKFMMAGATGLISSLFNVTTSRGKCAKLCSLPRGYGGMPPRRKILKIEYF